MIYWLSTGTIALMLVLSAASYLFHQPTIDGVDALGFPSFFRVQLAVLKLIAAPTLLLPHVPLMFKEWAYAGVALFIITAMIAHHMHRDSPILNVINVGLLLMLALSRFKLTAVA